MIDDPLLALLLPEALQPVVETDGAVTQEEPHVSADVGDEAGPLVGVVVDLLVEPGADLINLKNNSLSLSLMKILTVTKILLSLRKLQYNKSQET